MKSFKILFITVMILFGCLGCGRVGAVQANNITEELNISEFLDSIEENTTILKDRQNTATKMAECARYLGYPEDSIIIKIAKAEWQDCYTTIEKNTKSCAQLQKKFEEYPIATYVWLYLTMTLQYNDIVASGIIGNMMVEVGGKTLKLQPYLYSSYRNGYYYGLCQWNKDAYAEVHGKNVKEQCDFLGKTIEYELNTFGQLYLPGCKYESFLKLETTNEVALMFAKSYERCWSGSYNDRQLCTNIAYNYFAELN